MTKWWRQSRHELNARTGALLTLFTYNFLRDKIIECREKRFDLTTLVHRWYPEMRMIQQFCRLIWWKRNLLQFDAVQMAVVCIMVYHCWSKVNALRCVVVVVVIAGVYTPWHNKSAVFIKNNQAHSNSVKFANLIIINVCINVHSVNTVKLLTLTLSCIIIIISFNDTGFGG